jgi:hypothetical protein
MLESPDCASQVNHVLALIMHDRLQADVIKIILQRQGRIAVDWASYFGPIAKNSFGARRITLTVITAVFSRIVQVEIDGVPLHLSGRA